MAALAKPVLIYDGDCGFCRGWATRWERSCAESVSFVAAQQAELSVKERELAREAVLLREPDGSLYSGAEAVFRLLAHAPGSRGALLFLHRRVPAFRRAAERAYGWVARHRGIASRLAWLAWGRNLEPATYGLGTWLFLRGLGLSYLAAFASLWVQADGLYGPQGILPAMRYLDAAFSAIGAEAYYQVPSLLWFWRSDAALRALCVAGTLLSMLVAAGLAWRPALLSLWACYLSLVSVGGIFLGYQWDNLLLEAGFLALFISPRSPRLGRWLLYLLLFKLMLSSGAVKLLSGDPAWRDLTALGFHYETQCIPTPLAWFAHQLPGWAHRLSTAGMFFVELALPFFILGPRMARRVAGLAFIGLMLGIALTGNYAFFNLLTAALAAALLDDGFLRPWLPRRLAPREPLRGGAPAWPGPALLAGFLVIAALQSGILAQTLGAAMPGPLRGLYMAAAPLRSFSGYGLFAVMTKTRPELVLEGSEDGREWKAYEFKYKAGDPRRAPPWVAPHQPRLDWQMWFGALGRFNEPRTSQWLAPLMARLLEGSPPVLALLAENPFPERPPRMIRALLYEYKFAKPGSEDWWERRLLGQFSPVLARRD